MMRKIFILTALLLSQLVFAQTKILFDASKAESAGNADWVIDADAHNLGWDPGPYIGGHESNAQRIPTPSQTNVNQNTPEYYWTGALSSWAIDAVKLGYYVESLPYNGSITYKNYSNPQDLSNYDIFVVCEPNIKFTTSEKSAIMNFIKDGGGLFMISDHDNSDRNGDGYDSPAIWNDFINNNPVQNHPFGFTFDYEFFTEATNNIPYLPSDPLLHGSYGNVTSVEFYGGTSLTLNKGQNPSVKGVVYREGYSNTGNNGVLCAYATYGNGRVVALGDSSPADDGSGDNGDNLYDGWLEDANGNHERLIMNATIWLAQGPTAVPTIKQNETEVVIKKKPGSISITLTSDASGNFMFKLYDLTGKGVFQSVVESGRAVRVPLSVSGIYLYKVIDNQGNYVKNGKVLF